MAEQVTVRINVDTSALEAAEARARQLRIAGAGRGLPAGTVNNADAVTNSGILAGGLVLGATIGSQTFRDFLSTVPRGDLEDGIDVTDKIDLEKIKAEQWNAATRARMSAEDEKIRQMKEKLRGGQSMQDFLKVKTTFKPGVSPSGSIPPPGFLEKTGRLIDTIIGSTNNPYKTLRAGFIDVWGASGAIIVNKVAAAYGAVKNLGSDFVDITKLGTESHYVRRMSNFLKRDMGSFLPSTGRLGRALVKAGRVANSPANNISSYFTRGNLALAAIIHKIADAGRHLQQEMNNNEALGIDRPIEGMVRTALVETALDTQSAYVAGFSNASQALFHAGAGINMLYSRLTPWSSVAPAAAAANNLKDADSIARWFERRDVGEQRRKMSMATDFGRKSADWNRALNEMIGSDNAHIRRGLDAIESRIESTGFKVERSLVIKEFENEVRNKAADEFERTRPKPQLRRGVQGGGNR